MPPPKQFSIRFISASSFLLFNSHSQIRNTVHPRASNMAVTSWSCLIYYVHAFSANNLDDPQGACFGNHAHAKNIHQQIRLFSALGIQNQDDPLQHSFAASR